ncbi:HNH endonuclease [Bacillus sp. 1A]|uniref:HNH endonuclease n=1 Tax=Bacillus sp. 1A TaxID=3461399 RepID=UPI004043B149
MISLIKTSKPIVLEDKENDWTNELLSFLNSDEKAPSYIKGRYRHEEIKDALLTETNSKCAYCESKITHIDYGDIEHIVPKSIFPEKTFLWDNLTIGCAKCNQSKSNYYDDTLPLLNPYVDYPEDKLVFMGTISFAKPGCESAYFTIKKLKLNRPELIERRGDLIKKIQPLIWEYEKTENEELRKLLLEDLIEFTNKDQEYSLMIKQLLDSLAITA